VSEPAGTQTRFNTKTLAALANAVDSAALFNPLPFDWVPAFAGMTTVEMHAPRSTPREVSAQWLKRLANLRVHVLG